MKAYEFLLTDYDGAVIHSLILLCEDADAASKRAEELLVASEGINEAKAIKHYELKLEITYWYEGINRRIPVSRSNDAKVIAAAMDKMRAKSIRLVVRSPVDGCEEVLLVQHGNDLVTPAVRYKRGLAGVE